MAKLIGRLNQPNLQCQGAAIKILKKADMALLSGQIRSGFEAIAKAILKSWMLSAVGVTIVFASLLLHSPITSP